MPACCLMASKCVRDNLRVACPLKVWDDGIDRTPKPLLSTKQHNFKGGIGGGDVGDGEVGSQPAICVFDFGGRGQAQGRRSVSGRHEACCVVTQGGLHVFPM